MPKHYVCLSALAVVRSSVLIEDAVDQEDAETKAKLLEGDLSWRYDGVVEGSVDIDSCELRE